MLKEDNIRTGFLESADYDKLARECARWGLWMRTAFELGYQFGWRKSEVLGLKVCQVSIVDSTIRLNPGDTKNDEGREVSLTPNLRTLLQECIRGKRPADFVLTRKNGRPVQDFRGAWDNITAAADVPDLTFHDLRRTAARHLVRAGVPERVAMRVTGHKTRTIFDRYNITSQTDMEEAAIKLENYRLAAIRQRTVRVAPESQEVEACLQTATVPVN
jgi:integrase